MIGYNNLLIPECTFPGLCSVNSHVEELSALAVSNLVGAIQGKSVSHTTLLIPELVVRESVPGGN